MPGDCIGAAPVEARSRPGRGRSRPVEPRSRPAFDKFFRGKKDFLSRISGTVCPAHPRPNATQIMTSEKSRVHTRGEGWRGLTLHDRRSNINLHTTPVCENSSASKTAGNTPQPPPPRPPHSATTSNFFHHKLQTMPYASPEARRKYMQAYMREYRGGYATANPDKMWQYKRNAVLARAIMNRHPPTRRSMNKYAFTPDELHPIMEQLASKPLADPKHFRLRQ